MASVDLCNLPIELVCRVLATLELLDLVHCTQVSLSTHDNLKLSILPGQQMAQTSDQELFSSPIHYRTRNA